MSAHTAPRNPAVLSYYSLRRTVGIVALSLPFALPLGVILIALIGPGHTLPHPLLEHSISDYRYTPMADCLVGSLCAIAAFLMGSRGYDLTDEITGYLAGAFAFGLALCPSVNPRDPVHTRLQLELNLAHTAFAALMFLALAYFCLVLFCKSSPGASRTRRKRHRNAVYQVCGVVILVCDTVMVSLNFPAAARILQPLDPLLSSESVALMAFGVAWLTKGKGFLRDRPHNHVQSP